MMTKPAGGRQKKAPGSALVRGVAVIALLCAVCALMPGAQEASGHSMFNSAEEFMAGYRVQVATAPEFPQIDEPSMFLVRVTDTDFEEVDRFTM